MKHFFEITMILLVGIIGLIAAMPATTLTSRSPVDDNIFHLSVFEAAVENDHFSQYATLTTQLLLKPDLSTDTSPGVQLQIRCHLLARRPYGSLQRHGGPGRRRL